jgi:hypothetical protein
VLALWLTTGLLAGAEAAPPAAVIIDTGGSGNARRLARQRQKQRREAWEEEERRLAAIAAQERTQAAPDAPVEARPAAPGIRPAPDPSGAVAALRDLALRQAKADADLIEAKRQTEARLRALQEEEDDFAFIMMA